MSIQVKGANWDMRPLLCYDYGDMCEEITGGWSGNDSNHDEYWYISVGTGSDSRQSAFTLQSIDVTKYRTLEIVVSKDSSPPWDGQSVGLFRSRSYTSTKYLVSMDGSNAATMATFTLDISDLTGSFYPGASVYVSVSSTSGNWLKLYSVRLLK